MRVKRVLPLFWIGLLLVTIIGCARRGSPQGGDRDTTPPRIVRVIPGTGLVNFSEDEIRIQFNEYVKFKDLQKQLVISPPLEKQPIITPQGLPSKQVKIKFLDTLASNTTYTINFGNSIVDATEGNVYPDYSYVFSTGPEIDSLSLRGNIRSSMSVTTPPYVSVLLYPVDEEYTDSVVYNERPYYVTKTLDSSTNFKLQNLRAGTYRLVALLDASGDNKLDARRDQIGFIGDPINVPTAEEFEITLYPPELDLKFVKPNQISRRQIAFGYQGVPRGTTITPLDFPELEEDRLIPSKDTDSLIYWFRPETTRDTLTFRVVQGSYADTLAVRMRELPQDSMRIKAAQTQLRYNEGFWISANTPLSKLDESKMTLIDADSVPVAYRVELDSLENRAYLRFEIDEENRYTYNLLPGAIKDMYGTENDTLKYGLRPVSRNSLSAINVTLQNVPDHNLIVQLIDANEDVKYQKIGTGQIYSFLDLIPGSYYVRIIYDANNNDRYDTGRFLSNRQPERVVFLPALLDARSGWDLQETFALPE